MSDQQARNGVGRTAVGPGAGGPQTVDAAVAPPWNELDRLRALDQYGILDTPPEDDFDDLVRLAAELMQAPMAAVNLIAERRQWFKAEIGLGVREMPLDVSICASVILQPDRLVIPDLRQDRRFARNPLIAADGGLRFYAGELLTTVEGLPLGTLCVLDTRPRPDGLTPQQLFALRTLARQVMSQLDLRRTLAQRDRLLAEQSRLAALHRQTLDSATDYAIISTDPAGRVTAWNAGAANLLGWTEAEMLGQDLGRIHVPAEPVAASDEGRSTAREERWYLHRQRGRFLAARDAMPLRDESGARIGDVTVLRDRTERRRAVVALRQAETGLRRAQEAGRVGLFTLEIATGIISPTPEMCRLYGLPVREAHPAAAFERLVLPEDAGLASSEATRQAGTAVADVEYRIRRADGGGLRWIARRGEFEYGPDGRPARFVGVARDVTEERAAQRALAESEAHWRGLFEKLEEGFLLGELVRDASGAVVDWRYLTVNPAWERFVGIHVGQVLGRTVREALPGIESPWIQEMAAVVETGTPATFLRQVSAIGRWYEGRAYRTGDERFAVIFTEVTQRQQQERRRAALLDLGDRLRDEADPAAMALIGAEVLARVLGVDRAGYGTLSADGASLEVERDWAGPGVSSVAGRHLMAEYGNYGADLLRGEAVAIADILQDPRTLPGAGRLQAVAVRALLNLPVTEGGRTVAVLYATSARARVWAEEDVALAREVAERLRSAVERRRAEARLALLAASLERQVTERTAERDQIWRNSRDLLVVVGADGIFRAVSPSWQAILGHRPEEVVGRSFLDFIWPEDAEATRDRFADALARRDLTGFENRYTHRDGRPRWLSWHTAQDGALVYAYGRDVTAEKRQREALQKAEDQLRQSQKMEAVGQLTGGIAHDFNNLLTGITGSLEMLSRRVAQGRLTEVERYVGAAQGAARRAAALTHRLLAFSRRQTLDPRATDANRLIAGMEDLIRRTMGPSIAVETRLAEGIWATLVDPNQLENAMLNLAINARDAMPGGGRLRVTTENLRLDLGEANQDDLEDGEYVAIRVTDTGTGMSPDTVERAFEPFFTTKPIGQGTGLGLSMIYGFARQSGGQVRIESTLGAGTTMCLLLPRHDGEAESQEALADPARPPMGGAGETVLVVDDEQTVRMLAIEILRDLGYAAIEASDAVSGLRVLESDARVDLLVTDVGLPGMNGRRMADAARLLRPGLKVLFVTGYAERAVMGHAPLEPGMHVLAKPFAMETLAARIKELIAGP